LADAQAGEDAEGGVEGGDDEAARGGAQTQGDLEFRDDPEGSGSEVGAEAEGERGGFLGREAIEKEVGGDEVIRAIGVGGRKGANVGAGGGEAGSGAEASGARGETAQHGRAAIDGVGAEMGSGGEQAGEETAVSIAEDERVTGGGELRKKVEAAAFEERAEAEVFAELIDRGDAVEVGRVAHTHPVRFANVGGGARIVRPVRIVHTHPVRFANKGGAPIVVDTHPVRIVHTHPVRFANKGGAPIVVDTHSVRVVQAHPVRFANKGGAPIVVDTLPVRVVRPVRSGGVSGRLHRRHGRMKSRGVSRAASARMRRASGESSPCGERGRRARR
jgi:hypothetical protein